MSRGETHWSAGLWSLSQTREQVNKIEKVAIFLQAAENIIDVTHNGREPASDIGIPLPVNVVVKMKRKH